MKLYVRATAGTPQADDNGRIIRYVFSDSSVARDNHTINTAGWVLDNFLKNPVFLWAHDSGALPVGRVVDIGVTGERLLGNVEYLERDEYPFADTVYQLVRKGFLNATSVSWQPIEYRFSQDKGRAGGIDFLRQELLEVSQVPVPALPSALVTARAAGIDTQPMHDWLEKALDTGGLAMVPRAELEALRRAAKMPAIGKPKQRAAGARKRGLYDVCQLACLVNELGYLTAESAWEEGYEEDDSAVPAQLMTALKLLGAALVAMTQEEVAELLTGLATNNPTLMVDDEAAELFVQAASSPGQRLLRGLEVRLRKPGVQAYNIKLLERFIRAGRVLSAENEKTLRAAHGAITDACSAIMGVCDAAAGGDPEPESGEEAEAERARRARALRYRALALAEDE